MKAIIEVDMETHEITHLYKIDKNDALWKSMMLIGETAKLGSQPLKTGRARRMIANEIPQNQQNLAREWIGKCRKWHSHNREQELVLSIDDIVVIDKLAEICYKL